MFENVTNLSLLSTPKLPEALLAALHQLAESVPHLPAIQVQLPGRRVAASMALLLAITPTLIGCNSPGQVAATPAPTKPSPTQPSSQSAPEAAHVISFTCLSEGGVTAGGDGSSSVILVQYGMSETPLAEVVASREDSDEKITFGLVVDPSGTGTGLIVGTKDKYTQDPVPGIVGIAPDPADPNGVIVSEVTTGLVLGMLGVVPTPPGDPRAADTSVLAYTCKRISSPESSPAAKSFLTRLVQGLLGPFNPSSVAIPVKL